MEARTVDALPPVAADHAVARCLLAIELSKKSWIVAINTPLADKISRHTVPEKGALEADAADSHARCSSGRSTRGNDRILRGRL